MVPITNNYNMMVFNYLKNCMNKIIVKFFMETLNFKSHLVTYILYIIYYILYIIYYILYIIYYILYIIYYIL